MKLNIVIIVLLLCLCPNAGTAQERSKDSLDDQVVNVVKPYQPSISDAFKIKEQPVPNDSNTVKKKAVKYNIFSIPVASTFIPAKGKAATVDKKKRPKIFDNYASLGIGTYETFLGELYLSQELRNDQFFGAYLSHHSSFGDIDNVLLDNSFSKTGLNLDFGQNTRDMAWKVFLGYNHSYYNWYGLPDINISPEELSLISPGHQFNHIKAGGTIAFDDSVFREVDAVFHRFSDDNESGENNFIADFKFDIPLNDNDLKNEIDVNYLNGSFKRNYLTDEELNYGFVNVGLGSVYELKQDDLAVSLGVSLVYSNDLENSDNNVYIYPDIEASYRVVGDLLIAFAGIKGALQQNSYALFAEENPFVSPTLFIAPTDQKYNAFLGIQGKLSSDMSYSVKGTYGSEGDRALYVLNPVLNTPEEDYQYGNSFGVVYDDLTTVSIEGELNVDLTRNFSLNLKGAYFNYSTSQEEEAWNLPDFTASLFLDYQITEQWFTGVSAFFMGERKDRIEILETINPMAPEVVVLESFFDINAHLGYRINDQFSMFAKVNNITNQAYQRWANFPVQGVQFIAGATYQFDF